MRALLNPNGFDEAEDDLPPESAVASAQAFADEDDLPPQEAMQFETDDDLPPQAALEGAAMEETPSFDQLQRENMGGEYIPDFDTLERENNGEYIPRWEDLEPVPGSGANEDFEEYAKTEVPTILSMFGFDLPAPNLENVPEHLQIYKPKAQTIGEMDKMAAFSFTTAYQMTDVARGVKQILGMDSEKDKETHKAYRMVMDDDRFGGWATAGSVAGAIMEPIGLLVPAAKGATIGKTIAKGAAIGGTFGAAGYVDEEAGESRIANAMMGMVLGGTITGAIAAAPKVAKVVADTDWATQVRVKKAEKILDSYEQSYAELIAEGLNPIEVKTRLLARDPKLGTKVAKAFRQTGRIPHTLLTQAEAKQVVEINKSLRTPMDIALGSVKDTASAVFGGMDTIGGAISTRIKNRSEKVFGRLRKYEYNIRTRTHEMINQTQDFAEMMDKLSEVRAAQAHAYLVNGEYTQLSKMFKVEFGDEGVLAIDDVRKVLNTLGGELLEHNRLSEFRSNYFPRYIVDEEKMLEKLGKETWRTIEDAIDAAAKKAGRKLTPVERGSVINKFIMRPTKPGEGGPGFTKQRKLDVVPADMLNLYARPVEALHTYINNAILDVEKAKFFGKGFTKINKDGNFLDITKSVGAFINDEMVKGKLTSSEAKELAHLLEIRFGVGETSASKSIQRTKNVLYASLLGNPYSAVTQIADVSSSIYMNGIWDTAVSVAETLTGKTGVKVKDLGLVDKLNEEFASSDFTAKYLNKALRFGGFEAVDRMGKSTVINSSLRKYMRMFDPNTKMSAKAQKKALDAFETKYKNVFGDEFLGLVADLKQQKVTENVKLMLFNELADLQPIALSEMPEAYLKMPNGKIIYMFKTFMLKQFDILRRDAYNKMKSGVLNGNMKEFGEGVGNLGKYAVLIGSANTGTQYMKDWMMGRETDKDLPVDVPMNFLKTLGWSEYTQKTIKSGKPVQAAVDLMVPPVKIVDQILSDPESAPQFIPIVGRMYYNWFGGGLEKWDEKHNKGVGMFGGGSEKWDEKPNKGRSMFGDGFEDGSMY